LVPRCEASNYLDSPGSIEHRNLGIQREKNVRILSLYQKAASTREIICCLPLDELKQIAWNGSCLLNARLRFVIGQLEALAGLNYRLTGDQAENPPLDVNAFFYMKRICIQTDAPQVWSMNSSASALC
jgi:hypothetical protein